MRSLEVGRVISRAFGVMVRNPRVAFGIPLLLSALPLALFNYTFARLLLDIQDRQNRSHDPSMNPHGLLTQFGEPTWEIIDFMIGLFLGLIVQGCLVRAAVAESEGRRAGLGECLGVAAARGFPLVGTSILFFLGLLLGTASLMIPGVLFAVAFAVVAPVAVEEEVGVIEAFRRAGALTRGAGWKIFGLALVVLILIWLIEAILSWIAIALFHRSYDPFDPLLIVYNVLIGTIVATLASTIQTALYVELREWKDGPRNAKLGEIFE